MELQYITRNTASIGYKVERPGQIEEETATIVAHEAPLPAFNEAMNALREVVAEMLEVPDGWAKTATIKSLHITRTKAGTRSISVVFTRIGSVGRTLRLMTPFHRIDEAEEDDTRPDVELSNSSIKRVLTMINEGMNYVEGKRAQALLPLEQSTKEDGPQDDQDEEEVEDEGEDKEQKEIPFE